MNLFKINSGKLLMLFGLLLLSGQITFGQKKAGHQRPAASADTTKKGPVPLPNAIKPYKEVVTAGSRVMKSFFQVDIVKDRYFLEIPDSLLNKDILAVTRVEKGAAADAKTYSGDELGRAVITFDRIPGDKLAMRSVKFGILATDTTGNGLLHSLNNNGEQAIQAIFPVKAVNKDTKSTVIDITDFLNSHAMTNAFVLPGLVGADLFATMAPDRSYIDRIQAFPGNIEIKTVKTITKVTASGSLELNTSLLLLPQVPMKPRLKDPRIGFFQNQFVDFDINPHGVGVTNYIVRWRMEPKDEDVEKYKRGELVEPKKPIIIYIDPATPKKWVPYLIAGINDWQKAFEQAGFKNAIFGREAPAGDTTWSMNDARHSVLVYKPSPEENASGPNVNDPRTGEILETHINWYHNVMELIQNWYTIQAGAIDPRTHKPELDDELMGKLIRFVSSHEVGHTLGLEHNFGASSTVPVEKLRDKAWVEAHGHTPSIMDYARFNYVAQPEDHITEKGIFPRIGEYDKWAIEWGYKWLPQFKTAAEEKPYMNKWVVEKLASGKQFFYGSQLDPITDWDRLNDIDPRDQSEDLGDDAMLASSYGIKNLKRVLPHLMEWSRKPDGDNSRAAELYGELVNEYSRFMGHVLRNIGGIYEEAKTVEESGPEYQIEDKAKQQRAMAFLQQQLFTTPYWLMDKNLYAVSSASFDNVTRLQSAVLGVLLKPDNITKLISEENRFPGKAYTAAEMLHDLKQGIFSELPAHQSISSYRRDLQDQYVTALADYLKRDDLSETAAVFAVHSRLLATEIRKAADLAPDAITREHLHELYTHLDLALNPRKIFSAAPASAAAKPAVSITVADPITE
jgi:hypothetical protein